MSPAAHRSPEVAPGEPVDGSSGFPVEPGPGRLQELLAGYDREVEESLRQAFGSDTGTGRVRVLHNRLGRSIAVHDAVLASALCPLLDDLPGGQPVADRLRRGCEERAELLERFAKLTRGVAATNVYPVSGEEVEEILHRLDASFGEHRHDETARVAEVLSAAATSTDPEVLGALMAARAKRAPTRTHRAVLGRPRSALVSGVYRMIDRTSEWVDAHHGWVDPVGPVSPRRLALLELRRQAVMSPPTVRGLLGAYDSVIAAMVDDLGKARTAQEKADAVHRLSAAMVIHDSVVGGAVCPLLESVPGGKLLAARLRGECHQRAELLSAWQGLSARRRAEDLFGAPDPEIDGLLGRLVESFEGHEREESLEVVPFLERVPDEAYRTKSSMLEDVMWPWHGQGPALLALRMAGWARSAPTRVHPTLVRHPSSRVLRSCFHLVDHFSDYWNDSVLERWLLPPRPGRPFSGVDREGGNRPDATASPGA